MRDRFRLPCPHCSSINQVDLRQAGESTTCHQCRKTIEIPTMRGLRQLEPVDLEPVGSATPRRSSGSSTGQFLKSRILFAAGFVACFCGLVAGGGFWIAARQLETQPPAEEVAEVSAQISSAIDQLSLTEFWQMWHEQIIARPPGQFRESIWAINRQTARDRMTAAYAFLGLVPLGLSAMIGSAFLRQ